MPDSYTHFGQAKEHLWGADEVGADYGEVQRVRRVDRGTWKDLKNRVGAIVGKSLYDGAEAYETTVLLKKSKTPPAKGTVVSYKSKKYLIDSDVTLEQSNEDYQTLSFTMTHYENMPNP